MLPVRLRHVEHGADARPGGRRAERGQALLERHLEHRVVDVVPAPAGVELPGRLDAEAPLELGLDEEEEVLVLAGVGERRDVDAPLDVVERPEDRRRLRAREEALRGQHDRARAVDPHLLAPVVLLHALEERREHGLPVDRRPGSAPRRRRRDHRPYPLIPASITPRTMYFWSRTNTRSIGRVATLAPAITISHSRWNSPENEASPTGSV